MSPLPPSHPQRRQPADDHVRPVQRDATIRHRASLFAEAVAILEADYASELSLNDVARRVACSRRQLQRSFAEVGQTTFREHLAAVRMDRAAELLASGPMTVREIAGQVGYRQPAQFAKAFRRHHGSAPAAFRRSVARRPQAAHDRGESQVPEVRAAA
ncbi:MAG TPA: helix-turn-helix transcriptional regulator [Solirubrobacteraceae bacterium]|jgi:transcriptional regulator GlxA family with amidase domain|nr:helix-turn-helix transcriptional regulator [Solirubrobacteraceae bacterium]